MTKLACIHCNAAVEPADAYCESCGKALPSVNPTSPQIVAGASSASTAAGQSVQAIELEKKMKSAAGALLAVAILMMIGLFLIPMLIDRQIDTMRAQGFEIDEEAAQAAVFEARVTQVAIAAVFLGLFFWARKSPFPAAIVGLVLLVTLWVVNAILDPMTLFQGIIVKVILLIVLVKAVKVGTQHRRLQQEMAAGQGVSMPNAM